MDTPFQDNRKNVETETDRIDREATNWVVRKSRGLSEAEEIEYRNWLAADPRHQDRIEAHAQTWSNMDGLSMFRAGSGEADVDPDLFAPVQTSSSRRASRFAPLMAAAAAVAVVAVGAYLWRGGGTIDSPIYADKAERFETDSFERHFLADGSFIELKSDSEAAVHYTADTRRFTLLRGEAHFSVAKDPLRPFVVVAGETEIRAIGTAFNVRLNNEEVELLVTEGVVRLSQTVVSGASANDASPELFSRELTASQRAVVKFDPAAPAPSIEKVSNDDIDELLAWKHEVLDFEETPLSRAVLEFNRRNLIQIEIADESLADLEIGASFRSDNIEGLVHMLEITAGAEADRSVEGKILLRLKE